VAGERGDRRRFRALAAHVPDQRRHAPASPSGLVTASLVACWEEVVEVTADLDPLPGGDEPHGRGQPGHRRDAGREQRALQHLRDVALAGVRLRLRNRDRRELAQLGEDRLVARRERPLGPVDDLEHPERPPRAAQHHADRRAVRVAVAAVARERGAHAARQRLVQAAGDRRAARAEHPLSRLDGELQDLLRRERCVDPHRRVRERAQLHDVLVLEAGDLLHLAVAAMGELERRERLAEEHPGGLEQLSAAGGIGLVPEGLLRSPVMRFGEVEDAQPRAHGLASQRVRGTELALVPVGEPGMEGHLVALV
jgi:hypothetical protein